MDKIINGWEIAGTTTFQSGAPGNVELGYDSNWDGISNDRPMMGDPLAPVDTWGIMQGGQLCDGPAWYYTNDPCHAVSPNQVHWIAPVYTSQYNASTNKPVGRNTFVSPGRKDWTFSITKSIKIGEKHKVEFRTEMFNPFNHSNTGVPDITLANIEKSPYYNGYSNPYQPNLFGYLPDTISGNRSIRMWLKYSF